MPAVTITPTSSPTCSAPSAFPLVAVRWAATRGNHARSTMKNNEELGHMAQRGDTSAAQQLFDQNIGLAYSLAGPDDDNRQVALIALWQTCQAYDPSLGDLGPYAATAIRRELGRHWDRQPVVRIPRDRAIRARKVNRVELEIRHRLGREATDSEIGEAVGISSKAVAEVRSDGGFEFTNLDCPHFVAGASYQETQTKSVAVEEIAAILSAAVTTMNPREQLLIKRFMAGEENVDVAKDIGLSRERVRQIIETGLAKLRKLVNGRLTVDDIQSFA